jgi:predicted glutamine amidotransferase
MCGIFVAISADGLGGQNMKAAIYEAMVTGWIRGEQSTGVFAVNSKNQTVVSHKSVFRSPEFMDTYVPRRMLTDLDETSIFVGHHRWCTSGVVSYNNAHPHTHDHITLVHNGGIHNDNWLPHKSASIPSTDSARVAYNLANLGNTPALEFLSKLTGSYVFVWWDAKEGALKVVRNDQRPLSFAWIKGSKQIFFASEKLHLQWILDRNEFELQPLKTDEKEESEKIYGLLPLNLHTIKIEKGKIAITHEPYTLGESYRYQVPPHESYTGHWPHQKWLGNGGTPGEQSVIFLPGADDVKPLDPDDKDIPVIPPIQLPSLNKRRLKQLNEKLQKVGTEFGRVHIAQPVIYQSSTHGTPGVHGTGYFGGVAEKNIDFVVPNLSQAQYNSMIDKGHVVYLQVTGIAKAKNEDNPLIVCNVEWVKTRNHWIRRRNLGDASGADGQVEDLILGPQGVLITKPHYTRLVKDGCANCTEPILESDCQSVNWIKDDRPICERCWHDAAFWNGGMYDGIYGD